MTTRVVQIGDRIAVEVPQAMAAQLSLAIGDRVEWSAKGPSGAEFVKWTIRDGLLEVERSLAEKARIEEGLLAEMKRAEQGDVGAQAFLGMTSKDDAEAVKWLLLAAEQGDRFSMEYLGRKLLSGEGVEKNIIEGYFWLLLHASSYSLKSTRLERTRMHDECRELRLIAGNLTQEERSNAATRCRDWLVGHRLIDKCFKPDPQD